MILAYLLLITGLTISSVAIYYSVVGLTAIFSAAAIPIIVMGSSLEIAKLVCATWIKANWNRVPVLMRTYMCIAVGVLMLITSMGIFGFLSKAHNDQNLVSGDVQSKIAIYDEKIKTAQENIEADRKQLKQMDEAVDQIMGRSTDEKGADKANAVRKSQQRDRVSLAKDIETNQKLIASLNDEAAPIRAEVRKVDAEVGPIKYIAAFIYGTTPDASMLERAVTWIIILIVVVFDPLAVIMLLASQMTFAWAEEKGEEDILSSKEFFADEDEAEPEIEELAEDEPEHVGFIAQEVEEILPEAVVQEEPGTVAVDYNVVNAMIFEAIRELQEKAEPEKAVPEYTILEDADDEEAAFVAPEPAPLIVQTEPEFTVEQLADMRVKQQAIAEHLANIRNEVTEPQVITTTPGELVFVPKSAEDAENLIEQLKALNPQAEEPVAEIPELEPERDFLTIGDVERPGDYLTAPEEPKPAPRFVEAAPGKNRGNINSHVAQADNTVALGKAARSDFGNVFPETAEKGDTFLRVDYLPNRLFKYNGQKWIETDKTQVDVYAYEVEYIKHLITEIDAGRYDPESLTDAEREQIQKYLENNAQ